MTTSNEEFIFKYNTWMLASSALDDKTYEAELHDWITADTILLEPKSVPWGGTLIGFEGWKELRKNAAAAAESGGVDTEIHQVGQWDLGDGVVLSQMHLKIGPMPASPEPYEMGILEKFWIKNGRIVRVEEFYGDSAGMLQHMGYTLTPPK